MASPVLQDALATILWQLQQTVLAAAGDDAKALGPLSGPWRVARKELGLAGKWATIEETRAAVAKAFSGAGAPAGLGLSADMDFDMSSWDPASGTCTACGAMGQRASDGSCGACGAPPG